jgi:L-amino acid N-acyltransferase YncA
VHPGDRRPEEGQRLLVKIRHATSGDLDAALEIFNHEIVSGVNAWDLESVEGPDRERWLEAHADTRYPLLVAQDHAKVIGWAGLSPWAHHGAYERTAELSIFVDRSERGRGVGGSLLAQLISEARQVGHHVLIARIEASNEASRQLHLRAGFRSVGVMHEVGFKFGRFLDAEVLELLL